MIPRLSLLAVLAVIAAIGVAHADVITGGNLRVHFASTMKPRALPRTRSEPISISLKGSVSLLGDSRPPALSRIVVAINRHARVMTRGLPSCPLNRLKGLRTGPALAACGDALLGTGHFAAHIDLPEKSPFPSYGKALVFNTTYRGRPALVAQVYGPKPVPTVEILPIVISRQKRGNFGLTLSAEMPDVGNEWGYVTAFDLNLSRTYVYRGHTRSFLSAACPAPEGIFVAAFEVARGTFILADGQTRTRIVSSTCRVRDLATASGWR